MKYVTSDEFNAVHFAAKEISDTSKNSIYFPSSGMVSLNTMKEILVIPNDQKLAAKLSQKLRPEDIIRIESHNNCVHISVVKISSGVYYSENPSNNGQS